MAATRKPRGHDRLFSFTNGTSASLECAHVSVDGSFTKFLWANFYDQSGSEVASACKLLNAGARWRSRRHIHASAPMLQLLRDLAPHRGRWVRIEFAVQTRGAEPCTATS